MFYIFKIVSVLTFLKIVLLIVPIDCKNFANLNSYDIQFHSRVNFLRKLLKVTLSAVLVQNTEL